MTLEEYKKIYSDDDAAPGWDAIDAAVEKLYPDQEPKHYAATPHYAMGGENPLDGVSIYQALYQGEDYFHIVTYGFSELYYAEEALGGEYSKFGFELTFRIKRFESDADYPIWAVNLLQNIAKYVFKSGKWFEPNHYMPANGPIRHGFETELTGMAFALDPELGVIDTPHGAVQFLQVFGLNDLELNEIKTAQSTAEPILEKHRQNNALLITDLNRQAGG